MTSEMLKRIEDKIDRLDERQDRMDITIAKQEVNLEIHVKRSNLLEENMELLRKEFKPVQKHVDMMNGAAKLISILGLIAGICKIFL